jgi:hypothetical protein
MNRVHNGVGQYWPCLAAILLLWSAVAWVLILSFRMNHGHLIYALDDSYILMAMAKNFARHGVWGMTPFQFTSSSSSPLWTSLVAGLYWVFGVNTPTPLILNLLCATLLILALRWVLVSLAPALPNFYVFAVLICTLFFSPILNLIFIGLEHTLHILLTLLLVSSAGRILAGKAPPAGASKMTLIALGVATSAVRYEGLFAVAVVAALLFLQRRVRLAVELAACSLLPALIMGAISVGHGWFWLPNSVMLKGNLPLGETHAVANFLAHAEVNTLYSGMRVVRLEGVALLLMLWRYAQQRVSEVRSPESGAGNEDSHSVQVWMMGIFVATATLHLLLAGTGWFLRYEAYLIALGLAVAAAPLWDFLQSLRPPHPFHLGSGAGLAAVAVLVFSANLFWTAGYDAVWMTLPGMHDTYRWHYQMGTFVQRYYQGGRLVVNDIGAADFLADIHLTDPHGLADMEIARARLRHGGKLNAEFLDQLARSRGASVALVDENWMEFSGGAFRRVIPSSWRLAGVWRFHNRVVLAPSGLSFYALDEDSKAKLIENLRKYSPNVPADVEQLGPYTLPPSS